MAIAVRRGLPESFMQDCSPRICLLVVQVLVWCGVDIFVWHASSSRKKTKSVEAKPIALDDMVETVGDTFVAGGTLVAEEDSHIPIPHAGSGMSLKSQNLEMWEAG